MPDTIGRSYPTRAFEALVQHGLHPVLARVYAARGIEGPEQLDVSWRRLIPFDRLKNGSAMAALLADAILAEKRLLIVADYDADGATACAVGVRALKMFGAIVDYLVPNRFEFGYGLTPEIVRLAAARASPPDILITVDNGIASVEGVAEANMLGIQVLITDHHLPGEKLPDAAAIVNPNQPGCLFPSKHLAGVGVMFYMMLALRAELRARGVFALLRTEPNLASLLDLVALGTVADVVKLDDNNRILVHQGLERIRRGRAWAGIRALLQVTQRNYQKISTYDLAFVLGPRLNAAGRLDDMALGIECLVTDDESGAAQIALQLDTLNRQRQEIEAGMRETAVSMIDALFSTYESQPSGPLNKYSLSLFDSGWHQGVIGILASRLKEKFHRPVIAFAPGNNDEIKGSGRSIRGFHLRDALDLVSKRHPGLLLKFGGHAAAAGLTIRSCDFEKFRDAFEQTAQALLKPSDLIFVVETDGDLDESEMSLELARHLATQPWGQGFAQPAFNTRFRVENQRIVGDKHLKLKLKKLDAEPPEFEPEPESARKGRLYDGILFFHTGPLPDVIDAVYRMQINEFNGNANLQFILDHWKEYEA
jgi:single-stranded-DNA-specific exonuclease